MKRLQGEFQRALALLAARQPPPPPAAAGAHVLKLGETR
jgi:hypothetical protein